MVNFVPAVYIHCSQPICVFRNPCLKNIWILKKDVGFFRWVGVGAGFPPDSKFLHFYTLICRTEKNTHFRLIFNLSVKFNTSYQLDFHAGPFFLCSIPLICEGRIFTSWRSQLLPQDSA